MCIRNRQMRLETKSVPCVNTIQEQGYPTLEQGQPHQPQSPLGHQERACEPTSRASAPTARLCATTTKLAAPSTTNRALRMSVLISNQARRLRNKTKSHYNEASHSTSEPATTASSESPSATKLFSCARGLFGIQSNREKCTSKVFLQQSPVEWPTTPALVHQTVAPQPPISPANLPSARTSRHLVDTVTLCFSARRCFFARKLPSTSVATEHRTPITTFFQKARAAKEASSHRTPPSMIAPNANDAWKNNLRTVLRDPNLDFSSLETVNRLFHRIFVAQQPLESGDRHLSTIHCPNHQTVQCL